MLAVVRNLVSYRELLAVLVWKSIAVRYKQAFLGLGWAVVKPFTLMLVFVLVRSFIGIDSGEVPYPLLTFAALMPWTLFQESTADGVNSIVRTTRSYARSTPRAKCFRLPGRKQSGRIAINSVMLGLLMRGTDSVPA